MYFSFASFYSQLICIQSYNPNPLDNYNSNSSLLYLDQDGPFVWDKTLQGLLLSSFSWGYVVTQVIGGLLAENLGPKPVLVTIMALCGLSTILSPLAAQVSPYFLMTIRVILGFAQVSV